ncbi:MAG: LysR family transcriptional regulator [Acidobacteriaceae bacterium]
MDLFQLETFITVAEEKSFSRAAVKLHRTQPAVSQVIRKLEVEMDEVLFDRAARDATLTAAGEVLREYAERLLNLRGEATTALSELRSLHRGRLSVAANEYTCLYLLPVVDVFRRLSPQIHVTVQRSLASRMAEELMKHSVELGVISYRPDDPQIRSIVVYRDELVFVMHPGHPLARAKEVSIRELGAENFVAHNVPSPLRQKVVQAFQRHRTPLNMEVELPSLEAIKRFVAMGNGVALLPGLTARQEIERGELVQLRVPELSFERRLRIIHRRQANLSHASLAFLKVVESMAKERGDPFHYQVEKGS